MPIIEFEGLAENLIHGVKELTDAVVKLRSEVAATNDTIKKGAQESLAAEQKLGQTIEATARSMQDLNRESKAAAKSQAEVGKSAAQTAQASTGLVGVFKRMTTGIREFAVGARDGFRTAIKEVGGFRGIVQQVGQNIRTLSGQAAAGFKSILSPVGLVGRQLQGVASQVPVFGQLASALGPVGTLAAIAAGAIGGIAKRLDDVAVKFEGLSIASGFFLDSLSGGLKKFAQGAKDLEIGGVGVFETVQSAGEKFANFLTVGLSGAIKDSLNADLEAGQQIAQRLDALADLQNEVNVATAANEVPLRKNLALLRDTTKPAQERLNIAREITRIEEENLALRTKALRTELDIVIATAAQEQARKGEISDETKKKFADLRAQISQAAADSIALTEKVAVRSEQIAADAAALTAKNEEKKAAEAEKSVARRAKAAQDLAQLEDQLAQRGNAAAQQTADPAARINLQKQQAEAEVRVLEEKLKAANEAVGKGNKLTVDQEVQLADVRLGIRLKYEQDVQALELKSAQDRVALIVDSGEREREAFDLQLKAQIKTLEEAGATEIEIARFVAAKREEFRAGQVNKAIDGEKALALARIDAIKKGAETEEQFRQRIELLKLQAQEEFANQRLEALKDQTGEEVELTRAQLEAVLAEIVRKRAEIAANVPEVDIFSLLGLNLTDEQKKRVTDDLKTIGQAVQDAVIANIASQQQGVQAQLDATEQIIEDQRSRKDELIALLDEELEAQKNGFANNADAVRAEIQAVTDAENAALANRKKLVEEQKKLAAQQAKVESALQIAALLTANAYLLKDGALEGVPGTIAAIAFAISLIGTFASIRAKVRAANADTPAFWEGTTYVDKDRKHRTGRDTVPAMLTRGEAVIPVAPNSKYPKLVEGLVENDFAKMQRAAIEELLTGTGVTLKQDRVREIVRTNEKAQSMTIVDRGPDKALLRKVDELTTLLASFKTQEGSKPTTSSDGGRSVVTTPTRTVKRR